MSPLSEGDAGAPRPAASPDPYDPGCPFCVIVRGDASAFVVAETEHTLAFLDLRPLFPGHTLLVPRPHYVTLPDLPTDLVAPLFTEAQRLAAAIPPAVGAAGSFVAINNVVSQSVAHLHVHVVPRNPKDGLKGFFWPRTKYRDDDHAAAVAAQLRAALS
jgi:histidine triad (HIT) family protein